MLMKLSWKPGNEINNDFDLQITFKMLMPNLKTSNIEFWVSTSIDFECLESHSDCFRYGEPLELDRRYAPRI